MSTNDSFRKFRFSKAIFMLERRNHERIGDESLCCPNPQVCQFPGETVPGIFKNG
jgi:hypothetical protein